MKRLVFISFLALAAFSCTGPSITDEQHVAGEWALLNEDDFSTEILTIGDGVILKKEILGPPRYFHDGVVWNCRLLNLSSPTKMLYSMDGDVLRIKGGNVYVFKLSNDRLCLNSNVYGRVAELRRDQYSRISIDEDVDRAEVSYRGASLKVKYHIEQQIPGQKLSVEADCSWIKDIVLGDGVVSFTVESSMDSRDGRLLFKCPGAADESFTIVQTSPGSIGLPTLSKTFDYKKQSGNCFYTVETDSDPQSLKVVSDSDWIHDVVVDHSQKKVSWNLDDNNTGATRTGTLTFSCDGTLDNVFTIQQSYSAPALKFSDDSKGYTSDYYACVRYLKNITIENPRYDGVLSAASDCDWIHGTLNGNTLTVQVDKNGGDFSRSASFGLVYSYGGTYTVSRMITFTQGHESYNFTVQSNTCECNYREQDIRIPVTYVNKRPNLVLKASGGDFVSDIRVLENEVVVHVSENTTSSPRSTTVKLDYGEANGTVTIKQDRFSKPGEPVDLGLTSGTLWSDRNVFSKSVSDAYLVSYQWRNYDLASHFWDETWVIPSEADWKELQEQCEWKLDESKTFFTVKGPNGNSIIILMLSDVSFYWTSTPSNAPYAFFIYKNGTNSFQTVTADKYCFIRPVKKK